MPTSAALAGQEAESVDGMCRAFSHRSQAIVLKCKAEGFFGAVQDHHCNLPILIQESGCFQLILRGCTDNTAGARADKAGYLAKIIIRVVIIECSFTRISHDWRAAIIALMVRAAG